MSRNCDTTATEPPPRAIPQLLAWRAHGARVTRKPRNRISPARGACRERSRCESIEAKDDTRNSTVFSRRRHQALLAGAIAATAILSLSGCTLDFLPQQARGSQESNAEDSPGSGAAAGVASAASAGASDGAASGAAGSAGTGSDAADAAEDASDGENAESTDSRAHYADAVERTISCPGGALDIADVASVIALDSDCTDITVSGSGTVVLASNIDDLVVVGVNNLVFVEQLKTLDVTGSGNGVTWESGSPVVTNTGVNNDLNPAG